MVNYICEICNYKSNIKTHYNRHLHTKSHIDKITPEDKFCCNNCLKIFNHKSNLCKHKKSCNEKTENKFTNHLDNSNNIDNTIVKDPNTAILLLQQEIKFLKEKSEIESRLIKAEIESRLIKEKTENKMLQKQSKKEKKLLNDHKKELLKSKDEQIDLIQNKNIESVRNAYSEGRMNALTFVSLTYNKTPKMPSIPIESDYVVADVKSDKEIKYWIQQKPDFTDEYIAERLLHIYERKDFANYISNIIVKAYKKDDPAEQTFWASDVSRLIYIVRSTFNQKDEWVYDKKGAMIKESIIDPLLDEVYNIIVKYYKYMQKRYLHSTKKVESDYYMGKLPILGVAENLVKDFKNRQSVKNQILRILAPKFFLDRDLNKKKEKPDIKEIEYEPPKLENDTIFDKIKNKKLEESKHIDESSEDTEDFLNDPRVKYKMEREKELINIKKPINNKKRK